MDQDLPNMGREPAPVPDTRRTRANAERAAAMHAAEKAADLPNLERHELIASLVLSPLPRGWLPSLALPTEVVNGTAPRGLPAPGRSPGRPPRLGKGASREVPWALARSCTSAWNSKTSSLPSTSCVSYRPSSRRASSASEPNTAPIPSRSRARRSSLASMPPSRLPSKILKTFPIFGSTIRALPTPAPALPVGCAALAFADC